MIREPSWRSGYPELIADNETIAVQSGDEWNVTLSQERHCIGYHGAGKPGRTECMRDRLLPAGKEAQCEDCTVKDVSFAAKTGFGNSAQATELLTKDHAVYLALFSENIIKVGVSVWERREIRTKEQASTACLVIAKANGTAARNLERRIHTSLGFTEWVRMNQKLAALAQPIDEDEAKAILYGAYERVKEKFGQSALIAPEFTYHRDSYGLAPETVSLPIYQITKLNPGSHFGGTVSGVLGKSVLLKKGECLYSLDMNLLSGYTLQDKLQSAYVGESAGIETKQIEVDRQQSLLGLL